MSDGPRREALLRASNLSRKWEAVKCWFARVILGSRTSSGPPRSVSHGVIPTPVFTELPTGHLDDWNASRSAAQQARMRLHRDAERAWWSRRS